MNKWNATLDVSDVWNENNEKVCSGDITIPEMNKFLTMIISRIKKLPMYQTFEDSDNTASEDLNYIIMDLEELKDLGEKFEDPIKEFNEIWTAFYDWCDYNRVWIKTF